MKSMTLAEGDGFCVDVYYDIDKGKISTEYAELETIMVDIHRIDMAFRGVGRVNITPSFNEKMLDVIREQIIYWTNNPK